MGSSPKPAPAESPAPTRLIAMGRAPLMEGFSLLGMETWPDATPEQLERVLSDLVRRGETALVLLEHDLAASGGAWLERVRNDVSRIVLTEIPPLNAPEHYTPMVDRRVRAILGPSALEEP